MIHDYEELWQAMKGTKYANTLTELKEKITEVNDTDSALKMLLEIVVNAVQAEAGTLWYYDKNDTGLIYARAAYGGANLSDTKLEIGEGVAGNVILNNAPYVIENCENTDLWNKRIDDATGFKTKSMICVPLVASKDDRPFGAIQIINRKNGGLFDNKDMEFANEIASKVVDLFINTADEKTLDIIANKKYDLGLDTALNRVSEEDAVHYLTIKLRKAQLNENEISRIINDFIDIYRVVKK